MYYDAFPVRHGDAGRVVGYFCLRERSIGMDRFTSCCFTGHRNLTEDDMLRAAVELEALIPRLADRGITDFYAGGALGFDYAASVTVINSKRLYPDLTLNLALPCRDHMKNWRETDKLMFARLAERADSIVYVSDGYSAGCMQKRNCYMADRSSLCVCWLSEKSGGTYYTVKYAEKIGLEVINLFSGNQQIGFGFDRTEGEGDL